MTFDDNRNAPVRLPWLTMAATVLLAAGILVMMRPNLARHVEAYGVTRPAAGPVLRAAVVDSGSVRISWPAGMRADELSIQDGGAWRRIELDARARAAGEYVYRPVSSEVLVRLNAESVRVMGLAPVEKPSPAPVEVAKAEPAMPAPDVQTADRAIAPAPAAIERKLPQVFPRALRGIHGAIRVDVRVTLAADGSVQSAELVEPAKSPYFNRLSLEAARASMYPPSSGGTTMVLRYEYSRGGVEVSSPAE